MRKDDIPCPRLCPLRTAICHGTCSHYLEWDADRKQRLKAEKQDSTWTAIKGNASTRAVRHIHI